MPRYTTIPHDWADTFTVKEFFLAVKEKSFIDYDGVGFPMRDGMVDRTIRINPSNAYSRTPLDATHIVWYNR